eukprot:1445026-Rhodomonas_salina.1
MDGEEGEWRERKGNGGRGRGMEGEEGRARQDGAGGVVGAVLDVSVVVDRALALVHEPDSLVHIRLHHLLPEPQPRERLRQPQDAEQRARRREEVVLLVLR